MIDEEYVIHLTQGIQELVEINEFLTAENTQLREALEACIASIEHADMSEGCCCCGEDMLNHSSPMDCGHAPVDIGEYYASLALEKARAALKEESYD